MCGPSMQRVLLEQPTAIDPFPQLKMKDNASPAAQAAKHSPAYQMLARNETGAAGSAGASPAVSPRSACSTPGGADHCMGAQLHALVFGSAAVHKHQQHQLPPQLHQQQQPQQRISSREQESLLLLQQKRHRFPQRTCTSRDLRRASAQECGNPWASAHYRQGTGMLHSVAALGLHSKANVAAHSSRGSISKAKQVLAEAINSIPGAHGFGDIAPVTCDTGVLSPLLTIIRNNGGVSRRSSFGESSVCSAASSSSASSASSACSGTSLRSSRQCSAEQVATATQLSVLAGSRTGSNRLSRFSYSGEATDSAFGLPPVLPEEETAAALLDEESNLEQLEAQQQQQRASQLQKVVDCIDTVKYLSMDDSNRLALIDLGAVELLLSKLRSGPDTTLDVMVAALGALAALVKYDGMKLQLWDCPDSAVLLQLLASRKASPVVRSAHAAVAQLAWSSAEYSCSMSSSNSSIFDSVSSRVSSTCSSASSTCSGANELLAPALVPALARCLHPAADVPVLLSALKLLTKAASTWCLDAPSTPRSPFSQQSSQLQTGWCQVVFAVMPLLIPTHRYQGHLVLSAALELLVVLTEQQSQLHNMVVAAGCLAPLLALLMDGNSHTCLQAACILTGLVDAPAAQQKLAQEPALAALLRVLTDSEKSVDIRLAALHVLKQLAEAVPGCVMLLKLQSAVPAVAVLLKEVHDQDVRRAATGLLQLMGTTVVVKKHTRRSMDDKCSSHISSQKSSHTAAAVPQWASPL